MTLKSLKSYPFFIRTLQNYLVDEHGLVFNPDIFFVILKRSSIEFFKKNLQQLLEFATANLTNAAYVTYETMTCIQNFKILLLSLEPSLRWLYLWLTSLSMK